MINRMLHKGKNSSGQAGLTSEVLVFKTNLDTKREVEAVRCTLDQYSSIMEWSIDIEDVDNVLRVVTLGDVLEEEIIQILAIHGFYCEELLD
ncbi:MAG: hypothetical protein AAF693_20955 [Bacteroidota bacterium]